MNNCVAIVMTEEQCKNVAELVENCLLDEIRRDKEIDSIAWVKSVINALDAMKDALETNEL